MNHLKNDDTMKWIFQTTEKGLRITMMTTADYRRIARQNLRGHWRAAMGAGVIATVLRASLRINFTVLSSGGTAAGSQAQSTAEEEEMIAQIMEILEANFLFQLIEQHLQLIVTIFLAWVIVTVILGGAVTLGYAQFHLNLADGKEVRSGDVFSHFNRKWEGFCMQFFQRVLATLWGILFYFPGVIACYRYAMTPYILAENLDLSVMEAIGQSKRLMKGHKLELFFLDVSFWGWYLLCLLSGGIGFLWLEPYKQATQAAFYREISRKRDNTANSRWWETNSRD